MGAGWRVSRWFCEQPGENYHHALEKRQSGDVITALIVLVVLHDEVRVRIRCDGASREVREVRAGVAEARRGRRVNGRRHVGFRPTRVGAFVLEGSWPRMMEEIS